MSSTKMNEGSIQRGLHECHFQIMGSPIPTSWHETESILTTARGFNVFLPYLLNQFSHLSKLHKFDYFSDTPII